MLCATQLKSASNAMVSSMMSPNKSICRLVPANLTPTHAAANSKFRYDPYCWKALPSPAKSLISPEAGAAKKRAKTQSPASADHHDRTPSFEQENAAPTTNGNKNNNYSTMSRAAPQENRLMYASTNTNAKSNAPVAAAANKDQASANTNIPPEVLAAPSNVTRYVFVDFKHDSATYVAPFKISVGDMVFVEGDRGEDVGTVSGITTERPAYAVPCKVIRRVTSKDQDSLNAKAAKEANTVKTTQALADSLGLNIHVVDTEFQYDGNKLTVYFNSKNTHIDFRKLQRGLFREHRCRIWLSNMNEVEYQKKLPRCR